ncbi:hypothetical protein LPJ73_001072 [Coemansia sp. RSA 2703]|nr:hypothetical protein LPJ73_001072 [Coemansia sp. RSA 2703]
MHDNGMHGGGGHSNMMRSSVFVPSDWKISNNTHGLVNLIQGVIRAIDKNIAPERHYQGGHQQYGMHSMPMHHGRHNSYGGQSHGHGQSYSHGHIPGRAQGGHGGHGGHARHESHPGHSHAHAPNQSHGGHMNQSAYSHGPGHGYGHGGGPPHRTPNMSRVSVIDDRASMFSRRWDSLPRGSHAMVTESSVNTKCPRCRHHVYTIVRRQTGGKNILATATLATIGIVVNAPAAILPLALTALELNSLKRKVHYCPRCNYKMGKHVTISIPNEKAESVR